MCVGEREKGRRGRWLSLSSSSRSVPEDVNLIGLATHMWSTEHHPRDYLIRNAKSQALPEICWSSLLNQFNHFPRWFAWTFRVEKLLPNIVIYGSFSRYFPGSSDSKESACNPGNLSSIPALGRSPGEGNVNTLKYSCQKNPWTEEPGKLQYLGSPRVRCDWANNTLSKY